MKNETLDTSNPKDENERIILKIYHDLKEVFWSSFHINTNQLMDAKDLFKIHIDSVFAFLGHNMTYVCKMIQKEDRKVLIDEFESLFRKYAEQAMEIKEDENI